MIGELPLEKPKIHHVERGSESLISDVRGMFVRGIILKTLVMRRPWLVGRALRARRGGHAPSPRLRRTRRTARPAFLPSVTDASLEISCLGSSMRQPRPFPACFAKSCLPGAGDTAYVQRMRGAVSSVVEHYLDTVGVTGSSPVPRTILFIETSSPSSSPAPAIGSLYSLYLRRHLPVDFPLAA